MQDEPNQAATMQRNPQETGGVTMAKLRSEQNLALGFLGGLLGAVAGAAAWAAITGLARFQLGWMAVGVGFLVGFAVQKLGKGIDKTFGIVGAILALLACVAGNMLSALVLVAMQKEIPYLDLLKNIGIGGLVPAFTATFRFIDILFYAIAVYEGYKFSFRKLTLEEAAVVATKDD